MIEKIIYSYKSNTLATKLAVRHFCIFFVAENDLSDEKSNDDNDGFALTSFFTIASASFSVMWRDASILPFDAIDDVSHSSIA